MRPARDRLAVIPEPERRLLRDAIKRLNKVVDDLERLVDAEDQNRQHASNGRPKEYPDRGP